MRREELYLRDIVDASDAIQRFVEEVDEWTTATDDVPELQQQITSILDSDYGNQD